MLLDLRATWALARKDQKVNLEIRDQLENLANLVLITRRTLETNRLLVRKETREIEVQREWLAQMECEEKREILAIWDLLDLKVWQGRRAQLVNLDQREKLVYLVWLECKEPRENWASTDYLVSQVDRVLLATEDQLELKAHRDHVDHRASKRESAPKVTEVLKEIVASKATMAGQELLGREVRPDPLEGWDYLACPDHQARKAITDRRARRVCQVYRVSRVHQDETVVTLRRVFEVRKVNLVCQSRAMPANRVCLALMAFQVGKVKWVCRVCRDRLETLPMLFPVE